MTAMAHFLKTKTEPVLVCAFNDHCLIPTDGASLQYYKPWQLRSGDETVIREQIEDAEATVAREAAEFETRYPPDAFVRQDLEPAPKDEQPKEEEQASKEPQQSKPETEQAPVPEPEAVSKEAEATAEKEEKVEQGQISDPTKSEAATNGTDAAGHEQADAHHDDGGEVVEDNEDTVIY